MNKHLKTVLFWMAGAILFSIYLLFSFGLDTASQFLNVFSVEYTLSVDNLAMFMALFAYFGVETEQQGGYLKWGVIGAMVFRAIFIGIGAAILLNWHWVLYVLAAILLIQAKNMWGAQDDESEGLDGKALGVINFVERCFKLSPFMQVLLVIELCDIAFAVDSVPASFSVTQNPLVIWTANMFAIMGLRSLYFVVAELLDKFTTVKKYGVPAVLGFIGVKIMIGQWFELPTWFVLVSTVSILVGSAFIPNNSKLMEEEVYD